MDLVNKMNPLNWIAIISKITKTAYLMVRLYLGSEIWASKLYVITVKNEITIKL